MKKKLQIAAATGLAAVVAVGGTFAYFNETMTIDNPFNTGKYSTTMEEVFTPQDDWKPGVEVNKDVVVKNTGDQPVVVRVKFDEEWTLANEGIKKVAFNEKDDTTGVWKIVEEYQADSKDAEGNIVEGKDDGIVKDDYTVVTKNIDTENWILGSDGWYYYINVVKKGESTQKVLDSVTLIKDVDMGQIDTTITYSVDYKDNTQKDITDKTITDQETVASYIANGSLDYDKFLAGEKITLTKEDTLTTAINKDVNETNSGYSDSDYKLTITSQTVQATDAAIKELFELENISFGVEKDTDITWLKLNNKVFNGFVDFDEEGNEVIEIESLN